MINPSDLQMPSVEEAAAEMAQAEKAATQDPKDKPEYSFTLAHKDRRGKVWKGKFTTKILTIKEERQRGVLQAKLAGGVPFESLDPITRSVNAALSHLQLCLVEKPEWMSDIENATSVDLIDAIYREVEAHIAHYFRVEEVENESQGWSERD